MEKDGKEKPKQTQCDSETMHGTLAIHKTRFLMTFFFSILPHLGAFYFYSRQLILCRISQTHAIELHFRDCRVVEEEERNGMLAMRR